jgi:thiosulfate/3-mercaptopyruvate sulfurtransferase
MDQVISERGYAEPESVVTTEWVSEHLDDTENVRIIESDEDVLRYDVGHIPNSVKIDWVEDLNDFVVRDYLDPERFANLMSENGISPVTTIVFYGDRRNWWATYTLWVFRLFGHDNVKIMDGGRFKWEAEGRPMTQEVIYLPRTEYPVPSRYDTEIRAFRKDVERHIYNRNILVDVRSPGEYRGELLHMPNYPQEGALRGGNIPGAVNVPWERAVNEDGTFKNADALKEIYEGEVGLNSADDLIVYDRIGERSSHTWFVLTYLLGYDRVRNYDGGWTEWGNLVRAPIERVGSVRFPELELPIASPRTVDEEERFEYIVVFESGVRRGMDRVERHGLHVSRDQLEHSLVTLRTILESWPIPHEVLSRRFVALFVENAVVASSARIAYGEPALTEAELLAFLGHSVAFFNSFKHR